MDISNTGGAVLSVHQLNRQVRQLLESSFGLVQVEGEISNFVSAGSGHWYFSLKDDRAQVRCAMFRNRNQQMGKPPENGQLTRVRARISLYEGRGEFQLIVQHLEAAGAGALSVAFEKLKRKLADEGLFDDTHKQALPEFPRHVGVISSADGAAVHDIISVFRRRFPAIRLSVFPVAVQGEESAPAICRALQWANRLHAEGKVALDALVLARGGGSMEDLWPFNRETVARAIFESALPVVSAVGHATDFTIADFAADLRAPTPSAAAELLSPDSRELEQQFRALENAMLRGQLRRLEAAGHSLSAAARGLRHPGDRLREQAQRLDGLEIRLGNSTVHGLGQLGNALQLRQANLVRLSPLRQIAEVREALNGRQRRGNNAMAQVLRDSRKRLEKAVALLESLGPRSILDRGYAIVTNQQGQLIRAADAVQTGETIHTRLGRGSLRSTVVEREPAP